jgi:hypothetical protein
MSFTVLGADADALFTAEGFAAEFEQNALVLGLLHGRRSFT